MNPLDDQLDRLLRGAATVPGPAFPQPFGMGTQMLAAWRTHRAEGGWSPGLLRWGLLTASILMAVSLLPLVSATNNPVSDSLQLADSTVRADRLP